MFGSRDETPILFLWLEVMGWEVAVEPDGEQFVGVGRHCTSAGESSRIGACARTKDELAFQLFDAAMKIVEARGRRPTRPLLAA